MERNGIKAETWLAAHHPSQREWVARTKGIFSRDYAEDFRSCHPEEPSVELARDGLYEILPQGMFFTGQELLGVDAKDFGWTDKVLKDRVNRIKTVLLPFDSSYFNHSLALEFKLNDTLAEKSQLVLKNFFGNDFSDERNPYIKKMAPMVVQSARIRGDYRFLGKAITCILGFKTDYKLTDGRVRFIVNRPDLDRQAFLDYLEELEPFFRFVEEWFIPFELQCDFKVRDYERDDHMEGRNKLLLDYNATLGNKPRKQQTEL